MKIRFRMLGILAALLSSVGCNDSASKAEQAEVFKAAEKLNEGARERIAAVAVLEDLAHKGSPQAQEELHMLFALGDRVKKDHDRAAYWAYQRVLSGSARHSMFLAKYYAKKEKFSKASMYLFLPTANSFQKYENFERDFEEASAEIALYCRNVQCDFVNISLNGESMAKACSANKGKDCDSDLGKLSFEKIRLGYGEIDLLKKPRDPRLCIENYCPCDPIHKQAEIHQDICVKKLFNDKIDEEMIEMARNLI